MIKINSTSKKIVSLPKKYIKLVLTEDAQSWHRLVECTDGSLEYRMGSGKKSAMSPRLFIAFCRSIVAAAKSHQLEFVSVSYDELLFPEVEKKYGKEWIASTIAENFSLASYSFTKYKSKETTQKSLQEITLCGLESKSEKTAFERGLTVATYTNLSRDTANTSAEDMTPTELGKVAIHAVKGTMATVKILGEKELQKLKMGLLLAVGQGSQNETKLIVMEYYGAGKPKTSSKINPKLQPIVLIGKGITYDTGGLNVKPSGMQEMHMDMSGGSSVIAAVACAAKMGLSKNIIGLIPTAENAISDSAMRAGDIVTSMKGITVEVLHTDAEGRMILADALTYAQRYNPKVVLDVATLTGASLVALGQHASAIMTKDEKLETTLRTLGEESGDYVWPLPLWDEYKQYIKSNRADISNIATNFSRFGGVIEGGIFLSHFAPACPWAHIDIAPRMDAIASDKLAKGSTGEPVRLMVRFIEQN